MVEAETGVRIENFGGMTAKLHSCFECLATRREVESRKNIDKLDRRAFHFTHIEVYAVTGGTECQSK